MADSIAKYRRCQWPVGAFSGISVDGHTVVAGTLRCNRWDCPACHPRLKARLYNRIMKGAIANTVTGPFGVKFGTLTFGGSEARANTDPEGAYDKMSESFHKLIRALKAKYGHFHYFRVCEPHKDGWPHFHVLFAGDNIAPKSFLDDMENLWRNHYGLGFVRLNAKLARQGFNDRKHAVNYMLKYITKGMQKIAKGKRIFTASVGALVKTFKAEWKDKRVYLGSMLPEWNGKRTIPADKGMWVYDGHRNLVIDDFGEPMMLDGQFLVNTGRQVTDMKTHVRRLMDYFYTILTPGKDRFPAKKEIC